METTGFNRRTHLRRIYDEKVAIATECGLGGDSRNRNDGIGSVKGGEHERLHRSNARGHGMATIPQTHCLPTMEKGWAAANGRVPQIRRIKLA